MGFAPVAAVAILLIGGLASFVGFTVASDTAQDELRQASREAAALQAERAGTSITITGDTYQAGPDRLTLIATNSGSTVIPTEGLDVLLDGVVRTQDITFIRIDGSSVAYWAPLQSVEIRLDGVTSEPDRAALVAHNGVIAYWTV